LPRPGRRRLARSGLGSTFRPRGPRHIHGGRRGAAGAGTSTVPIRDHGAAPRLSTDRAGIAPAGIERPLCRAPGGVRRARGGPGIARRGARDARHGPGRRTGFVEAAASPPGNVRRPWAGRTPG